MAQAVVSKRKTQRSPEKSLSQDTDPKGIQNPGPMVVPPVKADESGPIEAWGLIHSPRGGDLWHAVKFEIKRKGFTLSAKEVDRLPATLKNIAMEHIRDNISRLKL